MVTTKKEFEMWAVKVQSADKIEKLELIKTVVLSDKDAQVYNHGKLDGARATDGITDYLFGITSK